MISNERRWPSHIRPRPQPYYQDRPKPVRPLSWEALETREIKIERKQFIAELKENPRGRFVRITESGGGRANSIVIPSTGLREFQKMLEELVQASADLPAGNPVPEPQLQ